MSQGLQGFILRQASTATVTAPVLNVASVRVASTYAGLFGNQKESKTPTLKASKKSIVCGEVYTGDEYNETITITGANLNTVEPTEVTLSQLKAAPADYASQFVTIKGLTFKDVADGATFKEGMAQTVVTDGSEEAKVRIFKNTTLIGTTIPTGSVTIIGLFTSAKQLIIAPRGADDIVEASAS